jgi:poly-gamma-glutamate synthesis protein (capsule biosynthesis protein)
MLFAPTHEPLTAENPAGSEMESNELVIGLMGDVMIGRSLDPVIDEKGYSYVWGDLLQNIRSNDVNVINLETTLTHSDKRVEKVFNFKASPDKVASLQEARVTIANVANNHILDFSEAGLLETLRTLKKAGILYAGAGANRQEATAPALLTRKGFRIGMLGFTDNEPGWKAGPGKSGTNYIDINRETDRQEALGAIDRLRKQADLVIVSIHWGPNMQEHPSPLFIEFAQRMIDHGADIIHGHSAHISQGIEVYKNKLILYDTGDFVDDYAVDPLLKNNHSFLYTVTVGAQGIMSLRLVPVLISHYQVNRAKGDNYRWSMQRVQQLSAQFGTVIRDDGTLRFTPLPTNR